MRIEDNESLKEIKKTVSALRPFTHIANFMKKCGIKNNLIDQLAEDIPAFSNFAEDLTKMPDRFNDHFVKLGWIAYESLDYEIIKKAVVLADEGNIPEAEYELMKFYTDDKISFIKNRLRSLPVFRMRIGLIEKAVSDYLEGRYYATVLVILSLVDGIVSDLSNSGLYTESSDVTAWDSIAGHVKGLEQLKKILTKKRNKTNDDTLELPYRNGILHGRDLGYDNELLAAKCLHLLFSVGDWARSLKNEPKEKIKLSMGERSNQIDRNERAKKAISSWKPRTNIETSEENIIENTPEHVCIKYFDFLRSGNFGSAAQIRGTMCGEESINVNKEAGKLRKVFSDKEIEKFKILEVDDQGPGKAFVKVEVWYKYNEEIKKHSRSFVHSMHLVFLGSDGEPYPRNMEGSKAKWKIIHCPLEQL